MGAARCEAGLIEEARLDASPSQGCDYITFVRDFELHRESSETLPTGSTCEETDSQITAQPILILGRQNALTKRKQWRNHRGMRAWIFHQYMDSDVRLLGDLA